MKKIVHLLFTLFFVVNTFSQTQPSIIGQWKVISVDDDGISMDFVKDSLSIIEELQFEYPTEATIKQKKSAMKKEFGNLQFLFAIDNVFKILDNGKTKVSGTYQMDVVKKTIIKITYNDSSGQQIVEDCIYFDINPYLLFSMKKNTRKFMLEKAK